MVVSAVQRQAISVSVSGYGCLAIGDLAAEKENLLRLTQSGDDDRRMMMTDDDD